MTDDTNQLSYPPCDCGSDCPVEIVRAVSHCSDCRRIIRWRVGEYNEAVDSEVIGYADTERQAREALEK